MFFTVSPSSDRLKLLLDCVSELSPRTLTLSRASLSCERVDLGKTSLNNEQSNTGENKSFGFQWLTSWYSRQPILPRLGLYRKSYKENTDASPSRHFYQNLSLSLYRSGCQSKGKSSSALIQNNHIFLNYTTELGYKKVRTKCIIFMWIFEKMWFYLFTWRTGVENPGSWGIFISLDISRYQLLGPELPGAGPQRLLDWTGGGRECFGRTELLIIHHTVTAGGGMGSLIAQL